MRFIGCKRNLLDFIASEVHSTGTNKGVFCDLFAGTATVGKFFKKQGFSVVATDLLYFSYVLQKTYLETDHPPSFAVLATHVDFSADSSLLPDENAFAVIRYLNELPKKEDFIYRNYTPEGTKGERYVRRYFTADNAGKIDAIRACIEKWRKLKWLDEPEYFYLLCALVESVPFVSNTSGTYSAFLKTWDARALKPLLLLPPQLVVAPGRHMAANEDSAEFIKHAPRADILYLDPPYNGRQYAPNYHILETIARWDSPLIRGMSGMRDYSEQKSAFCSKALALQALANILENAKYRHVIMSYSEEGILSSDDIMSLMKRHGKVRLVEKDYSRFKSNGNGSGHNRVKEHLYCLKGVNPRNSLNDLAGNEWLFFLQSVDATAYSVRGKEGFSHQLRKIHPSPKPPQLMKKYMEFFTKEGQMVLDPFMGVGGVLLGASLAGRRAVGVDLSKKYMEVYREVCKEQKLKEQKTYVGDSVRLKKVLPRKFKCDLVLTDPPYGDMLSHKRSGQRKKDTGRAEATPFTQEPGDLGNMSIDDFLPALREIIEQATECLKPKGYVVVFAKDMQPKGKSHNMLHCKVVETLLQIDALSFRGYKIWHDRTPKLYPFGYPHAFVANQLHQFVLIFRKES